MNAPRGVVLQNYADFSEIPFGAGGIAFDTYFHNCAYHGVVFVLFNGAVPDHAYGRKEYFQRWTWAADFGAPVFIHSDRLVGTETGLRLGWYVGRAEGPTFAETLTDLVGRIDVLFPGSVKVAVGSSGGGFAALMSVIAGPLDMAIVFNPQTLVLDYYPDHVAEFLKVYGRERGALGEADLDRLSARRAVVGLTAPKSIHYFQNVADKFHHKNHMTPFMDQTTKLPPEVGALISYHLYNAPESGHNPPTRDVMPGIIRNIVRTSGLLPRRV